MRIAIASQKHSLTNLVSACHIFLFSYTLEQKLYVLTPIFAVGCAFYLISYFHLKNLLFFSNAVAKPLLFYKRFFFFQSLSARTKLALFFVAPLFFLPSVVPRFFSASKDNKKFVLHRNGPGRKNCGYSSDSCGSSCASGCAGSVVFSGFTGCSVSGACSTGEPVWLFCGGQGCGSV